MGSKTLKALGCSLVIAGVMVAVGGEAQATSPGLDGKLSVYYLGAIYVVDPAAGVDRLGAAFVSEGDFANWSPSGDLLAINDGHSIVTIRPDGTGRRIVHTPDDCLDGRLTWSPDASQIAFQSCEGVSTVDVTTADVTPIPNSQGLRWLAWSPDGEWIAGSLVTGVEGDADIWKIRTDGSDLTQVVDRAGHQLVPSWSPDGTQIAFEDAEPGTNTDISVVPAAGGSVTNLTGASFGDGFPSWSPSGNRIAFNSSRQGGGLFTMRADGSDVRKVPTNYHIGAADWQPAQVVITSHTAVVNSGSNARLDIRVANPDTDATSVVVQRRVKPGPWKNWQTIDVDGSGTASVHPRITTTTLFRAVWAGDGSSLGGRSVELVVEARAVVTGQLTRFYRQQGRWHLYRNGQRVWYMGRLKPPSPRDRMCFELEVLRNGQWRDEFIECFRLGGGGRSGSIYISNVPSNERGRLRASFPQTPELLRDVASWSYFRMTA